MPRSEDVQDMEATAHGVGSSVNININDGFKLRWTHYGLLALSLSLSIYAAIQAYEVNSLKVEVRQWAFWSQRVESNLIARGIVLPPDPYSKKAD